MYSEAGKMRRALLGNNYRSVWNTPVEFPAFDIGTKEGGLTILKRGGGMQTHSVRMENKDKKQYVLRSVNKYVDKALPEDLRNTIAEKPVQDAISASNPYGAITVPPLADAIGVYHTNPELFWVPDDPRFGVYRDDLKNEVFLFEERPAGNRKDVQRFGRSKKIVSTEKTIKKIHEDHHHKVDQKAVVRARMLDMLLNDWDRHDDQWRWASFKHKDETTYKPIPRDRDQVYFVNEGFIMWLAARKWLMPKFQGFDYTIENVEGLGFNARFFDRTFMTEPDLKDWMKIVEDIRSNITDSVIHTAIKRFPPRIYDSIGPDIEAKLKSRRDLLPKYAEEYYRFLAHAVDVVGTEKKELFDVKRKENGNTEVSVYAINKSKKIKKQLYHREFKPSETKEIRLYGLKDDDIFRITGSSKKGIKVRIIGGKGKDTVTDSSKVSGISRKTVVYDRKDKHNTINKGSETKLKLSKHKNVNEYNRKQFRYNKTIPLVTGGYNVDDGVFIGGGVKIKRFNFRDSTIQKITGDLAFQTGAFAIKYEALFSGFAGPFDLYVNSDISFPRGTDNFYGLGNTTEKITDNKTYYRVRYKYARVNPMLKHSLGKNIYYGFGPLYQFFEVTDTTDRYIGSLYPDVLDSAAYQPHHYAGVNALIDIDTRDDRQIPRKGIHWRTELLGYYGLKKDDNKDFLKLKSELSFYLSFRKDPRVVFAFRAGGAANFGDYEFYYANFLGGKTNLRGFRSNRFAGDYSFYQNTEIRYKIMNINSYFLTGNFGFLLFNDIGRVWVSGEDSQKWHDGYGGGLWLTPFNFSVVTLNYNRSVEDDLITFTFSYLF
jgi:hypothetical protein